MQSYISKIIFCSSKGYFRLLSTYRKHLHFKNNTHYIWGFQYALPLAFLRYRSVAGVNWELRGLPIHKTSVHADVCSGCYQNSILVWLIIVRCVSSLGSSGVSRLEEFLGSERCADSWESLSLLAHGTHSFPVTIMYNNFCEMSSAFVRFYVFHNHKSIADSKVHKFPVEPPAQPRSWRRKAAGESAAS